MSAPAVGLVAPDRAGVIGGLAPALVVFPHQSRIVRLDRSRGVDGPGASPWADPTYDGLACDGLACDGPVGPTR